MTGAATTSTTTSTTAPTVAELLATLPTTGDGAVDRAMDQLRTLLAAPASVAQPAGSDGAQRGGDAQVLTAVHDALQRRLSATAG